MGRTVFLIVLYVLSNPAAAEENPHAAVLQKFDIRDDAAGIETFLVELHPTRDTIAQSKQLIEQLGAEDYFVREKATKQLLRMPVMPLDLLRGATTHADPEIRWRASQVLNASGGQSANLIFAALKTIQHKRLPGLTKAVLAVVPLCSEEYLLRAAREALLVTARDRLEDSALLRDALAADHEEVRIVAIAVLAALLPSSVQTDLPPLLDDESDGVRLAAARALAKHYTTSQTARVANHVDRAWLGTLGDLLLSDNVQVRAASVQVLRTVTKQQIAYTAYDDPATRTKAAAAWQEWIAGPGGTATLHEVKDQQFEIGRLLICYYGQNKVVELRAEDLRGDSSGAKPLAQFPVPNPWACQGLPNGHRLIASYNGRFVVEYDVEGKEVWRKDGLPGSPFSVQRLENGNTLMACSDGQKVVEINRQGDEVWSHIVPGRPMDARRLENGRTLITLQSNNQVIEIDQDRNEKWRLEGVNNPLTAQRLENGNTLVCETSAGRVAEYTTEKKLIWSKGGLSNPYDAQRLSTGNTVISDNRGVREVDGEGKVVWEIVGNSVSRISRF